jgi:hypothetical protein
MTDEIDPLRSSEESLRAKLAEVELQLQRLIDFETEYEATCKTECESAISRIARMERQKKEMLIELGKLVYRKEMNSNPDFSDLKGVNRKGERRDNFLIRNKRRAP